MLLQNINIFVYNTFCSATFYNDPPMITHAVVQELGPQEVKSAIQLYMIRAFVDLSREHTEQQHVLC